MAFEGMQVTLKTFGGKEYIETVKDISEFGSIIDKYFPGAPGCIKADIRAEFETAWYKSIKLYEGGVQ